MGGGLSKKQKAEAESKARAPPAAATNPHVQARGFDDDGWEIERVRNDEWEPVPYALLCPDVEVETPRAAHHDLRGPFDTPNGGAGVGSLGRSYLGARHASSAGGEMSELPPTALSLEVLEVGGLNELATPVPPLPACPPMSIRRCLVAALSQALCRLSPAGTFGWANNLCRHCTEGKHRKSLTLALFLFGPCAGQVGACSRPLLRGGGRDGNTCARQPGIRGDGPGEILWHMRVLPLA